MFDRKVIRIVTPGTLIDEKFMDPYENNFLLAIHPSSKGISSGAMVHLAKEQGKTTAEMSPVPEGIGIAWLDLSTGDFFTQVVELSTLASAITRIGAREIVLNGEKTSHYQNILPILQHEGSLITNHPFHSQDLSMSTWAPMLETAVPTEDVSSFTDEEIAAGGLLLTYVRDKLQGLGVQLRAPVRRLNNESMEIDRNSLRGLEVLETSKDGSRGGKGSLLHSIRRTVTKSGTRLLREWIGMLFLQKPIFLLQAKSQYTLLRTLCILLTKMYSFAFNVFRNYQCKT